MGFALFGAGLLPALVVLVYFYRSDRFPEPKNTIAAVAVAGALSILAVLPLDFVLAGLGRLFAFPYGKELFEAFVLAAFVEELTRYLIVYAVSNSADFDEPMDGPVYAVAAAMGFAAVENLAYVFEGGLPAAVARAVTAVPSHAANAVVMGYLMSLGRFLPERRREFYALALVVPILMHGAYDACLMVSEKAGPDSGFLFPLQLTWLIGLMLEFDFSLRLHRHLAFMQFGHALPWWIGRLPFGRPHGRIDPVFRNLTGLSQLGSRDLAVVRSAVGRRTPPPLEPNPPAHE
ncbi:MAG: PrsW family glutamic-type intramembrane protease [Candidatus Eisenbacteria bacterium]